MKKIISLIVAVLMIFAAMSTVTAVFENIISFGMDKWGWSRRKSCIINCLIVIAFSIPCILGFNVWSKFQPLGAGTGVLDLEDFVVSSTLLPLGSLLMLIFCLLQQHIQFHLHKKYHSQQL